jgi:hypothetical protein
VPGRGHGLQPLVADGGIAGHAPAVGALVEEPQGFFDLFQGLVAPGEQNLGQVGFEVRRILELDGSGLLHNVLVE